MLKNYFKTAIRNFLQYKVFSFINIGGLAIGLASCLALLLYVSYEWSYDQQFDHYKTIYRVYENQDAGGAIYSFPVTPATLAAGAQREIPGVVRAVRFAGMEKQLLSRGENQLLNWGYYADTAFFQMMSYRFLSGNKATALSQPHSIVLTQKMAAILFGKEDPMGKTVFFNKTHPLQVSGVIEDLPANQSLQFEYVMPWSLNEELNPWIKDAGWGNNNCSTLIELQDPAAFARADALMHKIVKAHEPGSNAEAFLHPMSQWHLYSNFDNGKVSGGGIEQVRLFSILAIAILLIACINFMNLSTARSQKRAVEVGIRKTIGSSRADLIRQFFLESYLFSLLASLLALLLLDMGLPALNGLLNTNLHVPWSSGAFWAGFVLIVFVTGLLAGSYPSFYLSSFQPVKVLKGWSRAGRGALRFRQTLVVFQFSLALLLIIAIAVIYLQVRYIRDRPIGFEPNRVVEIPLEEALAPKAGVLKNELLQSGVAVSACPLSSSLTEIWNNGYDVEWPGKRSDEKELISFLGVGTGFSQTSGVVFAKGRDFSPDHPGDSLGVLLNETAATLMSLKDPIGSRIRVGGQPVTVLGVFKDFVFGSPFHKADPLLVYLSGNTPRVLSVRLRPGAIVSSSVNQLSSILKKLDPGYPPVIHFVDQDFEQNYHSQQRVGTLASIFGSLAILISCMGLFGLATFSAAQRVKEIGIRKVLGATVLQIAGLLSSDFLGLIVLSACIAFPLGWMGMQHWLQQFDYRASIEGWIFLAVGIPALLIVLATVGVQAVRAAVADPASSLRSE